MTFFGQIFPFLAQNFFQGWGVQAKEFFRWGESTPLESCMVLLRFNLNRKKIRSRCYVRQFFLRQFFRFSLTKQGQVIFRLCFRTCHFIFLVEVRINRSKTGQHLSSINSYFDFWVRLGQVRLGQFRLGQVRNFFSSKTSLSISRTQPLLNCRRKSSRTQHLLPKNIVCECNTKKFEKKLKISFAVNFDMVSNSPI